MRKREKNYTFIKMHKGDSLRLAASQSLCRAPLELCVKGLRAGSRESFKHANYSISAECTLSSKSLQIISLYKSRFFFSIFFSCYCILAGRKKTFSITALHGFSSTKKYPMQMALTNTMFPCRAPRRIACHTTML